MLSLAGAFGSLDLIHRAALAQALLGQAGDPPGAAILIETPGVDLPAPTLTVVSGLPSGADAHGVTLFNHLGLVADFNQFRVFVVDLPTASHVSTIPTPTYSGMGTIAVSPSGRYALAMGSNLSSTLTIIEDPFGPTPTTRTIVVPSSQVVRTYQTQAIRFASSGRAFLATNHVDFNGPGTPNLSFVHVLDPPYTEIAFSMAAPVEASSWEVAQGIALSPDENQLYVANYDEEVFVFNAPFTVGSVAQRLSVAGSWCTASVGVSPDGARVLIVDYCREQVFSTAPSPWSVEALPVPASAQVGGLEHVAFAGDGSLAIVTGNSAAEGGDLVIIEAPFTLAGATIHAVPVPGGRGAGAVEMVQPWIFGDGLESGDVSAWSGVAPLAAMPSWRTGDPAVEAASYGAQGRRSGLEAWADETAMQPPLEHIVRSR